MDQGSLWPRLQAAATVLVALIGAGFTWQAQRTAAALNEAQAQLTRIEADLAQQKQLLAERDSADNKRLKVYEAVVKSLGEDDVRMQRVSAALVRAMLEEPLQSELLRVLSETGSTPEVREQARQAYTEARELQETRARVERVLDPRSVRFDWERHDYDLFWCETSGPAASALAQGMREAMLKQGARGRIRVRMLSMAKNAEPGYQLNTNRVRFNVGEEAQAQALAGLGTQIGGQRQAFAVQPSGQATPWYLSAFVCAPPAS